MTLLQHHVLALSLTAITTFGLGLLVFLAEPKRRLNQIFGLYSLAISWWALNEAYVVSSHNQITAQLWAYVEWPGVIFIAPTFLHSVFLLTDEKGVTSRRILLLAYLVSLIFLVAHFFSGLNPKLPAPIA